jgi:hypothetical protein
MLPASASFAAPWDRQLRISTPLICALIIALVVIVPSPSVALWFVKGAMLVLLFGIFAWAPRAYRIEGNELVVRRWIGSPRIPLSDPSRARLMPPGEVRGATRIWAVGCCFGYYGRFLNGFEHQTWYVTDRQSCVRLDCSAGIVVVSPSSPADFLSALPAFPTRIVKRHVG